MRLERREGRGVAAGSVNEEEGTVSGGKEGFATASGRGRAPRASRIGVPPLPAPPLSCALLIAPVDRRPSHPWRRGLGTLRPSATRRVEEAAQAVHTGSELCQAEVSDLRDAATQQHIGGLRWGMKRGKERGAVRQEAGRQSRAPFPLPSHTPARSHLEVRVEGPARVHVSDATSHLPQEPGGGGAGARLKMGGVRVGRRRQHAGGASPLPILRRACARSARRARKLSAGGGSVSRCASSVPSHSSVTMAYLRRASQSRGSQRQHA